VTTRGLKLKTVNTSKHGRFGKPDPTVKLVNPSGFGLVGHVTRWRVKLVIPIGLERNISTNS